ncbi:MAG: dihydrolipoamide acetyltransferase family protein [Bacteroidota bacterium]
MVQVDLIMPKMGESIMEATILNWVKQEGDQVDVDDTILEIATDKVDSEVPSPVAGTIKKILFQVDDVVPIGEIIAIIEVAAGAEVNDSPSVAPTQSTTPQATEAITKDIETNVVLATAPQAVQTSDYGESERFYSPLVRAIAEKEHIGLAELESIPGSGKKGRVTKKDMEAYLKRRDNSFLNGTAGQTTQAQATKSKPSQPAASAPAPAPIRPTNGETEIIEMDRMRRLIADHMVMSKQTSPHVTSYVEVDVTNIVNWRNSIKKSFQEQHGQKITFTPIFMEAVARAINDFPLINVSVDGYNIIRKRDINIGMATALPSGNLIVPVIKQADQLNLLGLTKAVNDLAGRARNNQLKPEEIQGGTFTLTNVGTFGNVMGTPIINQPQVAILAVGTIKKKPAVVETQYGDVIAIRHLMFMSLSYDHRVVDGALGGTFLRRIGDYLEAFDPERGI